MSSFHQQFASMPPPKPSALVGTSSKGSGKGGSSVPVPGSGGYGGPSVPFVSAGRATPFASGSSFEGFGGPSPAVEANVIHIQEEREPFRFVKWLVEPSIPSKPGGTHPYATSDIRRNMNRPECTAEWDGNEEVIFLYGYFENKEENIAKFYGSEGVGKSQIPPFYGDQNYISLRACMKECWERSNWGKTHNEWIYDQNLVFFRMKIPKASYKWMYQQKIIKEMGKSAGKQWVHLQRDTNIKSLCTYEGFLLWEAVILTREEFELHCFGPVIEQVRPSAPPVAPSVPQGVWKKPAATK